ncbi:transglutaminase family protein [Phyllobacterium sp. 0TCS1.6C]|uniref:transglutaminase family protein n=1 Tax=unclassified Phyllobacterium TaxID=2638441 RepID=UPI0022650D39|nr:MULTISPECIES: transglutaminase family protein [unclassified Phyllobacterium]MCX8279403.1 transglutaminase family protein [Phyllobacterium sp. 0TCS1.6C]MCX8292406.1 transglutaminase family protein [Phyllobacterium sp. 0TCS1.6A]
MLLTIQHNSHYRYDTPVHYAIQRLRLHPHNSPGQKVLEWSVTLEGATEEANYRDGYGNRTQLINIDRGAQELTIRAEGKVETEDHAGVLGKVYNFMPTWLYERETPLTEPGEALRELAATMPKDSDRLSILHRLMETINQRIAYVPGSTNVNTTGEEALVSGQGVCQDHTHAFLASARLLGIPARYVSGYLMMLDTIEQTASHAWAEAHIDGLGWVGFDAANNICPNETYVRLACGLDYRDAAPVSGVRFGPAIESLAVEVNVEQ